MAMLFYALLLCLASWSVDARSDYAGYIRPDTHTSWGHWGYKDLCAEGFYAYGFKLKVEGRMYAGDDTALNGIKLLCKHYCRGFTMDVTSSLGQWGSWGNTKLCADGYFLNGARARSEPQQPGRDDDTAVNNYNFFCKNTQNTANTQILHGHGMPWGSWTQRTNCPSGSYICGIKTKVEPNQGFAPDDTALNAAIFYCCRLKTTQC